MGPYLIDTNILIFYATNDPVVSLLESTLSLLEPVSNPHISVVTLGEIRSLGIQRNWGKKKTRQVEQGILDLVTRSPILQTDVVDEYADIDGYSLGKHSKCSYPSGYSSEKMGKNDLWIAATASIYNFTLVTADKDFEHLDEKFLKRIYVDQKSGKLYRSGTPAP